MGMLPNDVARCAGLETTMKAGAKGARTALADWPNQPVTYQRG